MVTLTRRTVNRKEKIEFPLHNVKCMHHHGYLSDDYQSNKHDFYEINFCKNGDVLFLIGKNRHLISRGDILLIPPNTNHYFMSSDLVSNYYDFYTLWMSEDYVSALKNQLPNLVGADFSLNTPHILHTTNSTFDFEKEFHSLYTESSAYGSLSEAYAYGATLCLLVKIISYATNDSKAPIEIEPNLMNEIIAYIDKHYPEKINLNKIAGTFHISKSKLSKLFQKELNICCHQYILKKRLSESLKLIHFGIPLKNVATQVGFADYSSFYRAFKNMYQISPTEYLSQITKETT